jgi:hypothetical protein
LVCIHYNTETIQFKKEFIETKIQKDAFSDDEDSENSDEEDEESE